MMRQTQDRRYFGRETTPAYGWCRPPQSCRGQLHVFVLNHNGRNLLIRCLPAICLAAERTRGGAAVTVIDNDSTDDSRQLVLRRFPSVGLYRAQNQGLASFNEVARAVDQPLVALCNNDVVPSPSMFDAAVQVLKGAPEAFAAAPLVRSAKDGSCEGPRARLRFRRGILHTELNAAPLPAMGGPAYAPSAGVVLVVWRRKFLKLGGFSAVYFPGRFEDLELCWRAWRAGWPVLAVEDVWVEHLGSATFRRELPAQRLRYLDARNAVLCTLRNVRSPMRVASCLLWAFLRMGAAILRGDPVQVNAVSHGLLSGLFVRNSWPAGLRRRPEGSLLRFLGDLQQSGQVQTMPPGDPLGAEKIRLSKGELEDRRHGTARLGQGAGSWPDGGVPWAA